MKKSGKLVLMIGLWVVGALVVLALVTRVLAVVIERAYPPQGRFVDVRGARLHVVDLGPRDLPEPAIVLIHGASANLESMRRPLGEALARRHRVILFDRPGHGWSSRTSLQDSTPTIQADMIAEALAKMGVDQVIMVGHSWGGALVAAFAIRHPDRAAGLVMLAPVTHPWSTGVAWYHNVAATPLIGPLFAYTVELPVALAMLKRGARGVFLPQLVPAGYVGDTALPLLVRPREFLANGHDMVTLKNAIEAQQPRYSDIKAPTIVMHGDADKTVSIAIHSRAFVREVAASRLIELAGIGHMVQNAAPDAVVDAIESLMPRSQAAVAAATR